MVSAQGVVRPWAVRSMALAIVARVPVGVAGLLIVLVVRDAGGSYALAGACSGAFAAGEALAAPALGRLIDRLGQSGVLTAAGSLATVGMIAFAVLPAATPDIVRLALAGVFGASQPPVAACARATWRRLMDDARFERWTRLDASLQEIAFMGGPPLVVLCAAATDPGVALVLTALLLGGVTLVFASLAETRSSSSSSGTALHRGRALSIPGVRTLALAGGMVGALFGACEVAIIADSEHLGQAGLTGVAFAAWGVGSLLGGIAFARRPAARSQRTVLTGLAVGLAASTAAVYLAGSFVELCVWLLVASVCVAPLQGALFVAVAKSCTAAVLTEAFTSVTAGMMAGIAAGSAAAGILVDVADPGLGFVLAGGFGVVVALLLHTRRDTLSGLEAPEPLSAPVASGAR